MLQAINDQIKGCLGIGIVVLIGLSFSLWGIQSYLDDSGPLYAAKVNGVEISSNAFDRSLLMYRQSIMQSTAVIFLSKKKYCARIHCRRW